jgi:hypothetical protein
MGRGKRKPIGEKPYDELSADEQQAFRTISLEIERIYLNATFGLDRGKKAKKLRGLYNLNLLDEREGAYTLPGLLEDLSNLRVAVSILRMGYDGGKGVPKTGQGRKRSKDNFGEGIDVDRD